VSNITGGALTYSISDATTGFSHSENYYPCLPASALSTGITVSSAVSASATATDINVSGCWQ
jgi:hypothetical protein